jgi:hypothetical protein
MRSAAGLLAALLLFGGCEGDKATVAAPETPKEVFVPDPEMLNLLDGVVVTHRTGELQFANSALHGIDGESITLWTTPPGDPNQVVTLALPVRTQITGVGVSTGVLTTHERAAGKVDFEVSMDGTSFQPLQRVTATARRDNQIFDSRPTEAVAIRATIAGTMAPSDIADLPEILIRGRELSTHTRSSINGRWQLNQLTATLAESNGRVYGSIDMDPPMRIEGAWDGRLIRYAWVRGREFGVGVLATDPSGQFTSGFWWFREAIHPFFGGPWFGEKKGAGSPGPPTMAVIETSLRDLKTFPVYLLRFDENGRLTPESSAGIEMVKQAINRHPASKFRLVINRVRGTNAEEDQAISDKQSASLSEALSASGADMRRLEVLPAGRQFSREPTGMPYYILMHSRVDLEMIEGSE